MQSIGVKRPLCYVKFCGGCNTQYDRKAFYNGFLERYNGKMDIMPAEEGGSCDVLLYIAGCVRRCTDLAVYIGNGGKARVVDVWDGNLDEAFDGMDALLGE